MYITVVNSFYCSINIIVVDKICYASSMSYFSKDLQQLVEHSILSAVLCCLSSLLVVTAQDVRCSNECPFVNPATPRLQLTLKPGINQAVCLDFEHYIPARHNFITIFNNSRCSAVSGFEANASKTVSCKILANLVKNRTNCTVQGVVIKCIVLRGFENQVDTQTSTSSTSDSSDSKSSDETSQDFEEFGLALQLNSTDTALTTFVSNCNLYIDVMWKKFRCNLEEYHISAIDMCSGVGTVLSQVGTTDSWFIAESIGISTVGESAILVDKSGIFCGQLSFNPSFLGGGLPCEVHFGNGSIVTNKLNSTTLVFNESMNYLAFKCSGSWSDVHVGEAQIIFERTLIDSSALSNDCRNLKASRPFFSRYASIPVHWAHGDDNICDKVTVMNFNICIEECTSNVMSNSRLCETLAEIILDGGQISDQDLLTVLGILDALGNSSDVDALEVAIDILDMFTDTLQNNSTALTVQTGMVVASVFDQLLTEQDNWRILQQSQVDSEVESAPSTFLGSLEQYLDTVGMVLEEVDSFHYSGNNIKSLSIQQVALQNKNVDFYQLFFTDGTAEDTSSHVEIPTQLLCTDSNTHGEGSDGCSAVVAAALVETLPRYLDQSLNNPSTTVNTPLLLLSIQAPFNADFPIKKVPVRLSFNPPNPNFVVFSPNCLPVLLSSAASSKNVAFSSPTCVFWNFTERSWSTSGITTELTTNGTYMCTTTHLTSFAVLVGLTDTNTNVTTPEAFALNIVSYIGCSVSLLCLTLSLLVFITCGKHLNKGVLLYVHINFCLSLCLGMLVFVGGIETAVGVEMLCTTIAVVLHYLFLSSFCWMLAEGIMLYLLVVKVFGKMATRWYYSLFLGWGLPLPIVAVSVGIRYTLYGTEHFCWLSTEKGTIWAFVGPMLGIICINSVFLVLTVGSLLRSRKYGGAEREVGVMQLVRSAIKSTVILLPLLGLTWVFGIFAVNENTTVFAWLFTVFNSLQGCLFFFFHVLRNKKVYNAIKKCLCCLSGSSVHRAGTTRGYSTKVSTAGLYTCTTTNATGDYNGQGIGFINQRYQSPIGRSYSQASEESSSTGELGSVEITHCNI